MDLDNFMNVSDTLSENEAISPLTDIIEQIMGLPENILNDQTIDVVGGMIGGAFTDKVKEDAIQAQLQAFRDNSLSKRSAAEVIETLKTNLNGMIDSVQPSEQKRELLNRVMAEFYDIFDKSVERYHGADIILPIMLEKGATCPTYAHETDACADLYAQTDFTVPAHSMGNIIPTGVHIALPEGWVALIFPRSSIGAKTPMRLSNSAGVIDEEYRGPLGVLYDNVSDSDVNIKAGDRVAQMLVMPSYKFKADVVDILPATDRGEGGFGSTGK